MPACQPAQVRRVLRRPVSGRSRPVSGQIRVQSVPFRDNRQSGPGLMPAIVTSTGIRESAVERAKRLQRSADIFRAAADDAVAENQRAYERALDAIERAETAEREADLAWWWAERDRR